MAAAAAAEKAIKEQLLQMQQNNIIHHQQQQSFNLTATTSSLAAWGSQICSTADNWQMRRTSGVNWEVNDKEGGTEDSWEMKAISRMNWDRRDVGLPPAVGSDAINNADDGNEAEANIYQLPTFRYWKQ